MMLHLSVIGNSAALDEEEQIYEDDFEDIEFEDTDINSSKDSSDSVIESDSILSGDPKTPRSQNSAGITEDPQREEETGQVEYEDDFEEIDTDSSQEISVSAAESGGTFGKDSETAQSQTQVTEVTEKQQALNHLRKFLNEEKVTYREADHTLIEPHPDEENANCHGYTITGEVKSMDASVFLSPGIRTELRERVKTSSENIVVFWRNGKGIAHSGIREGGQIRHFLIGVGVLKSKLEIIEQIYDRMYTLPGELEELQRRQEPITGKEDLWLPLLLWAIRLQTVDFSDWDRASEQLEASYRIEETKYGRRLKQMVDQAEEIDYSHSENRFQYEAMEKICRIYSSLYESYSRLGMYEEVPPSVKLEFMQELEEIGDQSPLFGYLRQVIDIQPYESRRICMAEEERRANQVAAVRKAFSKKERGQAR